MCLGFAKRKQLSAASLHFRVANRKSFGKWSYWRLARKLLVRGQLSNDPTHYLSMHSIMNTIYSLFGVDP